MPEARWRGVTLARSPRCPRVDGHLYFPPDTVELQYLRPSATRTRCPHKGEARHFDVVVGGAVLHDAAWCYPDPLPAARAIRDHIAFWRGVEVLP